MLKSGWKNCGVKLLLVTSQSNWVTELPTFTLILVHVLFGGNRIFRKTDGGGIYLVEEVGEPGDKLMKEAEAN